MDSNLLFVVNERPFSVYITLRKNFLRGHYPKYDEEATSKAEILKIKLNQKIKKSEIN